MKASYPLFKPGVSDTTLRLGRVALKSRVLAFSRGSPECSDDDSHGVFNSAVCGFCFVCGSVCVREGGRGRGTVGEREYERIYE